jgi:hypothetical protein
MGERGLDDGDRPRGGRGALLVLALLIPVAFGAGWVLGAGRPAVEPVLPPVEVVDADVAVPPPVVAPRPVRRRTPPPEPPPPKGPEPWRVEDSATAQLAITALDTARSARDVRTLDDPAAFRASVLDVTRRIRELCEEGCLDPAERKASRRACDAIASKVEFLGRVVGGDDTLGHPAVRRDLDRATYALRRLSGEIGAVGAPPRY